MNRQRRRKKCEEITFFLLESEPNGLLVSYIANVIDASTRYRMSMNRLGQIMKPHVKSGRIVYSLTVLGHSHWKLNDAYIPPVETTLTDGLET